MWPFKPLSPPPMPSGLREMLKEYPEHIERLQESLNSVITKPVKSQPLFEVAIWELEGTLEVFMDEARKELNLAKSSGDPKATAQAVEKERLMTVAMLRGTRNLSELRAYFEEQDGGLK